MSAGLPIVEEFFAELKQRGANPEICNGSWQRAEAVYRITGLGYVLIAATDAAPGEWQLAEADVQRFQQLAEADEVPGWFVLLISRRDGRGANGYLLSDLDSAPVKRPFDCEDETYHVREKRHLDSLRLLLSTEKIADVLLRNRHD